MQGSRPTVAQSFILGKDQEGTREEDAKKISENVLLGPLSRKLLWIFPSNLPRDFALKNGGAFGEFCQVFVSHETKHENSLKNSGKIRSKIWDENQKKIGELSFCNFSDLTDGLGNGRNTLEVF